MPRSVPVTLLLVTGLSLTLPTLSVGQVVTPDVGREAQVAREVLATPAVKAALNYVDRADDETIQEWPSICNAYGPSAPQTRSACPTTTSKLGASRSSG